MQVKYILENCKEDMDFFNTWVEKGIIDRLNVYLLFMAFFCCCIYCIGVYICLTQWEAFY
jgi:hypothetical protein